MEPVLRSSVEKFALSELGAVLLHESSDVCLLLLIELLGVVEHAIESESVFFFLLFPLLLLPLSMSFLLLPLHLLSGLSGDQGGCLVLKDLESFAQALGLFFEVSDLPPQSCYLALQ